MRWMIRALTVLALAGVASPAAAQQRRAVRPAPVLPTGAVTPDGRIWERIQLQYVDVRAVAAALQGAPVIPSDFDLWRQTMGMLGGQGGFGGYGGFGGFGGYGGYGGPVGGGFGGGYPGAGLNGMGFNGGGAYGAQGGAFGNGRGGNRFIADPNSNSLITGRGRRGGAQGSLFPNVPIIVDPNTNALIVDP